MDRSNLQQIKSVLSDLGLDSLIDLDSGFGKAVLEAAEANAKQLPRSSDFSTLMAAAMQPGRLAAMGASVQKATSEHDKKSLIADAIAPGKA